MSPLMKLCHRNLSNFIKRKTDDYYDTSHLVAAQLNALFTVRPDRARKCSSRFAICVRGAVGWSVRNRKSLYLY